MRASVAGLLMALLAGAAAAEPPLPSWTVESTAPIAAHYVEETYVLPELAGTRLLLRRPDSTERFSGTVQLELLGDALTWQRASGYLTGNGDVWVGLATTAADDVLAQVAALLRSADGPLGKRGFVAHAATLQGVFRIIASGWAAPGCRLEDFVERFHAAARRPNGRPLIDAYFVGSCERDRPLAVPKDAPVIELVAETGWRGATARQPDGDEAGVKRFRRFELAGMADGACAAFPAAALAEVSRALLGDLDRWLRSGFAPPPARPFELAADGTLARDAQGHVLGGLRPHWIEVPATLQRGCAAPTPLAKPDLARLYPNHAAYVAAVARHLDAQVNDRTLLYADAKAQLDVAAKQAVP